MDATNWVLFIAGILLGMILIVLPRRLRAELGAHTGLFWLLRFLGVFIFGTMLLWAEFISGLSGFTGINIHRLRDPTLFTVTFYVLLSALIVMILKQIKWAWLRSSLITLYFCITVFAFILITAMDYSWGTGFLIGERYLFAVSTAAENVRILKLLRISNAVEVNSNQYAWVVRKLELEIDMRLSSANDYLVTRRTLRWRLPAYLWNMCSETDIMRTFQGDLPSVVEYRETHPPVWKYSSYDQIMKRYKKPNQASEAIGAETAPQPKR